MVQTLEAFIDKLRTDGVESGRAEAEKIRAEAEQRAAQVVLDAEQQAAKIIVDAQAEAEKIRERTRSDLELAARDTIVRLRQTLSAALREVLRVAAEKKLSETDFIGNLIRDLVMRYVQADLEHRAIVLNVDDGMRRQLADWAIQTLHKDLDKEHSAVELHGALAEAGFEYRVGDGAVEVTVGSVVEVLSEMVNAELRQLITRAVASEGCPAKGC